MSCTRTYTYPAPGQTHPHTLRQVNTSGPAGNQTDTTPGGHPAVDYPRPHSTVTGTRRHLAACGQARPACRGRHPAIGVATPVAPVELDADGVIQAPPLAQSNLVGWYRHGPRPGEIGPAVILGHLDTVSGPAVFAGLADLRAGDTITITAADGTRHTFIVSSHEQVAKNAFPTPTGSTVHSTAPPSG